MNKKSIVIEFFKYQLPHNDQNIDKAILDYITVAKVSLTTSKEEVFLATTGQIDTLEQSVLLNQQSIFQAIQQLDLGAIEEINNQNYKYRFKIPVHFRWASDFCPSSYEQEFREMLQISSQLDSVANFVDFNKQSFSLSAYFEDEVTFETKYENTDFFLDLKVQGIFSKKVSVNKFKGSIDFSGSYFEEQLEMMDLVCSSIVFSESIFDNQVEIRRGIFEKDANFYNTKFRLAPILSEVIFRESVNFINTQMNFTFYELKQQIEEIVKKQYPLDAIPFFGSGNNEQDKAKSLYREKISSDFQDTFRLIKNILIKENNAFEASKYHKMELYAKEIGLIGVEDRGIIARSYGDFFRNVERIGKMIDRWQLAFYRHLSDHHTNLLRIFNNFVITNFLFFMLLYFLKINFFKYISSNSIVNNITQNTQNFCLGVLALFISYPIFRKKIKSKKDREGEKRKVKAGMRISLRNEVKIFFQNFQYLILFVFIMLLFNSFFFSRFSSDPYILSTMNSTSFGFIFLSGLLFLITNSSMVARMALVLFSYICFFFLIMPILFSISANVLNLKKLIDHNPQDPFFYFIIFSYFFFNTIILWSLQKTARKNSIIPS